MFTHIHLIGCQRTDVMATRDHRHVISFIPEEDSSDDDDCERDIKFSEFI